MGQEVPIIVNKRLLSIIAGLLLCCEAVADEQPPAPKKYYYHNVSLSTGYSFGTLLGASTNGAVSNSLDYTVSELASNWGTGARVFSVNASGSGFVAYAPSLTYSPKIEDLPVKMDLSVAFGLSRSYDSSTYANGFGLYSSAGITVRHMIGNSLFTRFNFEINETSGLNGAAEFRQTGSFGIGMRLAY